MTKQHIYLIGIGALIVGAIGGAIAAPFTYKLIPQSRSIVREILKEEGAQQQEGTLQQTVFLDEESATIDVVEKVNSAVVSISILKDVSAFQRSQIETFPFDDFFSFPFDVRTPQRQEPEEEKDPELRQIGGGSGFIIESDGLIVTNKHVVDDEDATYKVLLSNDKEYTATVLAKDPILDVALIKIEATELPTLPLGNSGSLKLGQTVIAIGNALSEFGNTVTRGVVSGIGRRVEAGNGRGFTEVLDRAIQTDAAINPGNSGGPLLNLAGEVVGINTAVSQKGQSVGFAIPINDVKKTIESVRENGRIIRPWIGVRFIPVTPRLAEMNNLSVTYGALVLRGDSREELAVIPGSPADKAGIVENDIILEISGQKLDEKDSLSKEIAKYSVNDTITFKLLHKGEEKEVALTLEEFPTDI